MSHSEEKKCSITNPCDNNKVCNLDSQVCESPHRTNLLIGNRKYIGGPILKEVIQRKYGHLFNSDTVCDYGMDLVEMESLQGKYKDLHKAIENNQLLAFYDPISKKMLCQLRSDVERYWASKYNTFQGIVLTNKEHNDLKKNNTLIYTYKYTKDREYFLPIGPLAQGTFILQKQKESIKDHSFFVLIKTDSTWIDTNHVGEGVYHNFNPIRNDYGDPFYILFPVKEGIPKTRWDEEKKRKTRWDVEPQAMENIETEDYKTEQVYVSQQVHIAQKILKEKLEMKISSVNSRTLSYNDFYKPVSKIKNYWKLLLKDIKDELNIDKTKISVYVGDRKNGVRDGKGYVIKSTEPYYMAYYGEYKDDKRHGIGITEFVLKNYSQGFIGEWKNGKKNGYGYMRNTVNNESEEWVGYWKNDKIIGDGYYQLRSSIYEGEAYLYFGGWKDDFQNGKGIEFIPKNKHEIIYINIGEFFKSTFTGNGLRVYNSKTKQYGTFFNSILQRGTVLNKNYFIEAFTFQNKRSMKWLFDKVVSNKYNAYYLSPDYQYWAAFTSDKFKWKRGKIGFDDGNCPFTRYAHTIKGLVDLFPYLNNETETQVNSYLNGISTTINNYLSNYPRTSNLSQSLNEQAKNIFYILGKTLLVGWTEIEV